MASAASSDGLFRPRYEASISGFDSAIERRPYHRNCGCALHRNKSSTHKLPLCNNVKYPMRRAWSEGSLALAASAHSSPSSSPAAAPGIRPPHHDEEGSSAHKLGVFFEQT